MVFWIETSEDFRLMDDDTFDCGLKSFLNHFIVEKQVIVTSRTVKAIWFEIQSNIFCLFVFFWIPTLKGWKPSDMYSRVTGVCEYSNLMKIYSNAYTVQYRYHGLFTVDLMKPGDGQTGCAPRRKEDFDFTVGESRPNPTRTQYDGPWMKLL